MSAALEYAGDIDNDIVVVVGDIDNDIVRVAGDIDNDIVVVAGDIDNDIVVVAGDIDSDIVVVAGDTLVLLMFHWKEGMNIYMLAETPNKKNKNREFWKIENLVKEAG